MKFSIIIASFLGEYRTAARNRDKKIVRAIDSIFNQSFQDFEIVVVADGCQKTVDIVSQIKDPRLSVHFVPKFKVQFGGQRNVGIENAKGDYIIYLDIDDLFGRDHLKNISEGLGSYDWVWFNDVRYNPN